MSVIKDTADVRARLLEVWQAVEAKKMSAAEARVHIGVARAVVDTLKVEIAAAHLAQAQIPAVPMIGKTTDVLPLRRRQ